MEKLRNIDPIYYVIAALLLILIMQIVQVSTARGTHVVSWEYSLRAIADEEFDTAMLIYGLSGWELVYARRATIGSGYKTTAMYEVIFKRPVKVKGYSMAVGADSRR